MDGRPLSDVRHVRTLRNLTVGPCATNFSGLDLSNQWMVGEYFNGANFSGTSFTGAELDSVDAEDANFGGANFTNASMAGFTGFERNFSMRNFRCRPDANFERPVHGGGVRGRDLEQHDLSGWHEQQQPFRDVPLQFEAIERTRRMAMTSRVPFKIFCVLALAFSTVAVGATGAWASGKVTATGDIACHITGGKVRFSPPLITGGTSPEVESYKLTL